MNLSLSPVTLEDAEDLVTLRIAAMQESLERIGRFDQARARERFLANFTPEYTRHIELDGIKTGFVVVKPFEAGLLLDHLYIHPDFQGRGLGSRVLETVFTEADEKGFAIRVGALKGSDSNRFYQRHGFKLVEQADWDNYYLRPARV